MASWSKALGGIRIFSRLYQPLDETAYDARNNVPIINRKVSFVMKKFGNWQPALFTYRCLKTKYLTTYAIFSDGERHGTSSSISSSDSSSSSWGVVEMFNVDDVNMSGTGRILGRRLPLLWLRIWKTMIWDRFWRDTHQNYDSLIPESHQWRVLKSTNEALDIQILSRSIEWVIFGMGSERNGRNRNGE